MAGYIRQDTANEIDNGQVISAPPLDAEFNALVAAFSAASGHRHNGTTGEGAPITVVGPVQDVVVSTNSVTPKTDNTIDLGSSTFEFKDLWIDGTANIDNLVADAGTVGGAAITTASNTQTLTNKTLNLASNTLVATSAQLATAVTDETGTGALVFADSPALSGVPTAPTAAPATNTTQVATTAHVFAERSNAATLTNKTLDLTNNTLVATSAQLATAVTDETGSGSLVFANSPALTGTPTAPTAAAGTNTTQVATTAHVFAERSNTATLTNKTLTSPTISGGTISGITDLAVADGGTGASTPLDARANLGVAIGTDVQAYDAGLQSIAGLTTSANQLLYTTAADTYATSSITTFGRNLIDDADAAAGRSTLGLGTISTQNSNSVSITGGSVTGITDLAIADGGTGASTAPAARTNLGLVIGTDVQAYDAGLQSIAGLSWVADRYPYTTGVDTFALGTITSFGRMILDDADAPAVRATIGAAQEGNITTTSIAPATLVTSSEGILSNNNDTTLPTSAAVASLVSGTRVLLASKTASSSASLEFTEFDNAVYRYYVWVFEAVKPATDAVFFRVRFSSTGGAPYNSGASDYQSRGVGFASAYGDHSSNGSSIVLTDNNSSLQPLGNASTEFGVDGEMVMYQAGSSTNYTRIRANLIYDNLANSVAVWDTAGRRMAASQTTAVEFSMSSGNIASGVIRMYGIRD